MADTPYDVAQTLVDRDYDALHTNGTIGAYELAILSATRKEVEAKKGHLTERQEIALMHTALGPIERAGVFVAGAGSKAITDLDFQGIKDANTKGQDTLDELTQGTAESITRKVRELTA